jgi:hypothetical protein
LAVLYLVVQGLAVIGWWTLLLLRPEIRQDFTAPGSPDATLLAFIVGDLTIYATGSLVAAYGLAYRRSWGWAALCVNTGAGVYAALYGLALPMFSGGAWIEALMMAPALVVLPALVWLLRPEKRE